MKNITKATLLVAASLVLMQACKKEPGNNGGGGTTIIPTTPGTGVGTGPGGTILTGTDPSVAVTQGFFLDGWTAKTFTTPPTGKSVSKPSADGAVTVVVDLSQITTKVSSLVFGNNINPFMSQVVDQPALMTNLKALSPNIIRAPGGSLSDVYFWNGDGSGNMAAPADAPSEHLVQRRQFALDPFPVEGSVMFAGHQARKDLQTAPRDGVIVKPLSIGASSN